MAYYNPDEEEQEEQGPIATGAESGVLSAGAEASSAGDAAGGPVKKAEPFVGISQYINANKPQSEKLASQVVGKIDEKAQGVDSALSSAQNSFNQAADSQKVEADEGLFGAVKSNAESVVGDAGKASQFTKLRDASYSGPQSIQDIDSGAAWGGIQSALQKAKQAKEAAGTEAGRMGLIKEVSNNPRQSQGALTFDNLLLQSNPNAAGMLQNAGASLNDADARISGAAESAAQKAKDIAAANAAVSSQAKGAVKSGFDNLFGAEAGADGKYGTADDVNLNLSGSLSARAQAAKQAQSDAYGSLYENLRKNDLSAEDYSALGLNPNDKTYRANLLDYLSPNQDADIRTSAGDEDYARQAALASLMGDESGPTILNEATDRSLMGKAGKGYEFNNAGLSEKISADKQDYKNEYNDIFNSGADKSDPAMRDSQQKVIDWIYNDGPRPEGWSQIKDDSAAKADVLRMPGNQFMIEIGNLMKKYGLRNSGAGEFNQKTPKTGLMSSPKASKV